MRTFDSWIDKTPVPINPDKLPAYLKPMKPQAAASNEKDSQNNPENSTQAWHDYIAGYEESEL